MASASWYDIPEDLKARIGGGDSSALGPLAAWLVQHPPRFVSEDVRQKVLATLCRLMSSRHGRALLVRARSVGGLLRKIAARHRNDERAQHLRGQRAAERIRRAAASAAAGGDPAAVLSQHERREAVVRALARLSDLERDAVVRALMLDQSYRRIATDLLSGVDPVRAEARIRKMVHRARRKLQAPLRDHR